MDINKIAYELEWDGKTQYGAFAIRSEKKDITVSDMEKITEKTIKSLKSKGYEFKITKIFKSEDSSLETLKKEEIPYIDEVEKLSQIIQEKAQRRSDSK